MIPFLVPRRPDGGERDRLYEHVRTYWREKLPEAVLVEGASPDGPFNRGAAVNRAAELAGDWSVAVVADGDVVADPDQIRSAVEVATVTGRACFAFDQYVALDQTMTDRVLDGYDGDWTRGIRFRMGTHVSSLLAVPRDLWEIVDGFDERIVGWGFDDVAFYAALRELGGGVDRIPGIVWHLEHAYSPERDKRSRLYRAGEALSNRYSRARGREKMNQILDERDGGESAVLVVLTDGRRDQIVPTLRSFEDATRESHLAVSRKIISDDSGDRDYEAWLRYTFEDDGYEIVGTPKGRRSGFGNACRRAQTLALESGQRWVVWLEDDFVFERTVDLGAVAHALHSNPGLSQMAFQRQPWFPREVEHGGVLAEWAARGATWDDRGGTDWDSEHTWIEHDLFWTTNPHVVDRLVLAEFPWPTGRHSESLFTARLTKAGLRFGYWGRPDEVWVRHGGERVGTGY